MHDNATNPERITVPNTGFYQVDVLLNVTNSGSTVAGNFQLKKDGSILTLARYLITGSDYAAVHISMVVSMTATNYLEVYSQSAFSGTYNLASSSYSQITVKQVR